MLSVPCPVRVSDRVQAWISLLFSCAICLCWRCDVANSLSYLHQVVLLGAGLDTRAWRLPLPAGTKVFEVDEPALVSFKLQRLAASGAQTEAGASQSASRRAVHPVKHPLKAGSWHAVPADLARPDWHEALTSTGFDKGAGLHRALSFALFCPCGSQCRCQCRLQRRHPAHGYLTCQSRREQCSPEHLAGAKTHRGASLLSWHAGRH